MLGVKLRWNKERLAYQLPVWVCLCFIVFLLFLPTGFEDAVIYQGADRCKAKVVETDNSHIVDSGLIRSGEQLCDLLLLGGRFEGRMVEGYNMPVSYTHLDVYKRQLLHRKNLFCQIPVF